jgi:hypothetical protein
MATRAEASALRKLALASSDGQRSVVLASQIEEDEVCYRAEAVERLKAWEQYGWGKLIVGRRGRPTRFQLSSAIIKILKGSRTPGPQNAASNTGPIGKTADSAKDTPDAAKLVVHQFQLRADLKIEVNVPADLTDREATRLARFVESLPL